MLSSLRVYKAMLTLRGAEGFTQRDLAEEADVKEATVATIVRRQKPFLEELGRDASKQRGGKRIRYRLNEEGRRRLDEILAIGSEEADASEFQGSAAALAAIDVLLKPPSQPPNLATQRRLIGVAERYWRLAGAQPDEIQDAFDTLSAVARREIGIHAEPPAIDKTKILADKLLQQGYAARAARLLSRVLPEFLEEVLERPGPTPSAAAARTVSPATRPSQPRALSNKRLSDREADAQKGWTAR